MALPALPHDVWVNIANFIPVLSLRQLATLNSSLLHIALDARYRQISFIYWDHRLLRNLIRLKDPYIARRVKILHIYPGFLKEVMDNDARLPASTTTTAPRDKPSSFRERLADITQQLREYQDKAMDRLRERLRTAQDVMAAMLDLLRSLPSLTDYYVTWHGLPSADPFHSHSSSSSLPDSDALGLSLTNLAVPVIGTPLLLPSLNKLSLDVSLENIHALCSASFHVARLEELHLHIHSDHPLPPSSVHNILNTRLARSISNLSPYLRLLSIEAHEPMDVGPLFQGLDLMSKLETLSLAIPIQKPHLGNPKSLGRFLRRHSSTIKVLRIRATQHDAGSSTAQSSWRKVALGEYEMESLDTLEVSSNLVSLETSLYLAERFGGKLKSLAVLGTVKSFEFVKELLKVLGRKSTPVSSESPSEEASIADGEAEPAWQWMTPAPATPTTNSPSSLLTTNWNLRTLKIGPEIYEFLETLQNEWCWSWWGLRTISVWSENTTMSMPLPLPLSTPPTPSASASTHAQSQEQQVQHEQRSLTKTVLALGKKGKSALTFSSPSPPAPSTTPAPALSSLQSFNAPTTTSPKTSSKGSLLSKTVDSVITVTSPSRKESLDESSQSRSASMSVSRSTSASSSKSPVPEPISLSPSISMSSLTSEQPHESLSLSLPCPCTSQPPLPLLQLPPMMSTKSMSTPASPLSSKSYSPDTPTPSHPFRGDFAGDHSRGVVASSSSYNTYSSLLGGSASTSALPSTTTSLSTMAIGSLSATVPSSNSRGDVNVVRGYGSSSGVSDRHRATLGLPPSTNPSGSLTGLPPIPTSPNKADRHGHPHHMFSFLRSKSRSRKDKDSSCHPTKSDAATATSTHNSVNTMFGSRRINGGGAITSAHAGLLPLSGASASVAAAFGAPSHYRVPASTHTPLPPPPIITIPSSSTSTSTSVPSSAVIPTASTTVTTVLTTWSPASQIPSFTSSPTATTRIELQIQKIAVFNIPINTNIVTVQIEE
ncbi:hypothetical protein AN958_10404 [Leucoagaricus sp. SymC.cos]|nr:hypothetical protein AN958_10404 [Leucoagaricus sp. SymC.cos]